MGTLTMNDILLAAIMAFIITALFYAIKNSLKNAMEFKAINYKSYGAVDVNAILKKCYSLFPKDRVLFKGQLFKRGMNIRVTTVQKKVIEGKLIGLNNDNVVCIITKQYIVAHGIENITEIVALDSL